MTEDCGCEPAILVEPKEFSEQVPFARISQVMCRKHALEHFGDIIGSKGTS